MLSRSVVKPGADPGEGERVTIPPPLSLSFLAVICSRFFVVEVIFFAFLFLLRMTKGDNKEISKLCFYQKSYHRDGRKRHHFNHINEPTNTFGQLVTIKSLVSIQWTMLCCWSSLVVHVVIMRE